VKKEKDPNLPTRPKTAYVAFCEERRPFLKEKNLKLPEQSTILAKEWKTLLPEEKKVLIFFFTFFFTFFFF